MYAFCMMPQILDGYPSAWGVPHSTISKTYYATFLLSSEFKIKKISISPHAIGIPNSRNGEMVSYKNWM